MKKKMMLVNYEFTTGTERFSHSQIVSLRFEGKKTEEQEKHAAIDALIAWFKKTYPESELQSVVPWPTIYADIPTHNEHCEDVPFGWFGNEHRPWLDKDISDDHQHISDLVLIDIDGKRETFVTGKWHSKPDGTGGWWAVDPHFESSIDHDNMRWSYLPLAKYDK
jgi:hypothetical protein